MSGGDENPSTDRPPERASFKGDNGASLSLRMRIAYPVLARLRPRYPGDNRLIGREVSVISRNAGKRRKFIRLFLGISEPSSRLIFVGRARSFASFRLLSGKVSVDSKTASKQPKSRLACFEDCEGVASVEPKC